jgi:hypothetical protein
MQIKWQKNLFLVHFFAYLLHLADDFTRLLAD